MAGLLSYPEGSQREAAVARRLRGNGRGLGYLAAVDFMFKVHGQVIELDQNKEKPKAKKAEA